MFTNARVQRAVGQGFFQSAELDEDGELRLRYIYDCGAKSTYEKARSERIDELLKETGKKAKLDLLFLSHVHEDHVNGVEQLLDTDDGLAVDTIVLPLLPAEERLIAYARSIVDDPNSGKSDFFRALIVDPAAALRRFGPRQIFFVRRGSADDGAPGSRDGPIGPVDGGSIARVRAADDYKQTWKLVGSGAVEELDENSVSGPDDEAPRIATIPDSAGFSIPLSGAAQYWLLAPFVDPMVEDKSADFLEALAASLTMAVDELETKLTDAAFVHDLVVNEPSKLKAAYNEVDKDLNVTSLCLYSGPARPPQGEQRTLECEFGSWHGSTEGAIAWLGTGDAALKEKSRRTAFIKHYGDLLQQVATLTMPHHGSDHNFHVDLLKAVDPLYCVVAADKYLKWNHPGPHAAQAVASSGRFLSVVTSNPASTVAEQAQIIL
ncbi:hypothetical protein [Sphingopyxis panaciterrae]